MSSSNIRANIIGSSRPGVGGGWDGLPVKKRRWSGRYVYPFTCESHTEYRSAYMFWLSSGQRHRDVGARLASVIAIESGTQGVGHFDHAAENVWCCSSFRAPSPKMVMLNANTL